MSLAEQAAQHREAASVLMGRGLLVAAREELGRCLALVEAANDPGASLPVLNMLAAISNSRGEADVALGYLKEALDLVERTPEVTATTLRVYMNAGFMFTEMGRLDDALAMLQKAEQLQVDRDPNLAVSYWLNRCLLHWRRQEWVPTRQASDKAYEASMALGDFRKGCKALTNRGIAHLELGAYRLAERDLQGALKMAGQLEPSELAYAYAELGRLHFLRGDYSAALEAGREALNALFTDVAFLDKEEVARVSRLFGTIFSTLGQRNLALKYLNRSAAYYSQLGFRAEWQRSTEIIGQVLSGPVRPARSQLQAEVQQLDFLTGVLDLTDDLESVDPYLRGHSERVASMAKLLGEEIALSPDELRTLSYAARLHDVGMIAVEVDLIRREGPLSESERARVAKHTEIGEEMLRPYGLSEAGLKAIRHHHERYGGGGSPDGLAGEEIPLLARIIAVVDVYDALTSERAYRGAMTHDRAVEELRLMAGRELDPGFVEQFIALHDI